MKKYSNIFCFPTRLTAIFIAALLFLNVNLKAQDDANCGIYVDGTFADKMDCWTFDHMYLIFPINEKYKNYDMIFVTLMDASGREEDNMYYHLEFSSQAFGDNFAGGKYGVWKIFTDKTKSEKSNSAVTDAVNMPECGLEPTREKLAYRTIKTRAEGAYYQLQVCGYMRIPTDDGSVKYGDKVFLYKSPKVPLTLCFWDPYKMGAAKHKCPFDINAACPVTGKKVDIKVEASPAYQDHLGIIK